MSADPYQEFDCKHNLVPVTTLDRLTEESTLVASLCLTCDAQRSPEAWTEQSDRCLDGLASQARDAVGESMRRCRDCETCEVATLGSWHRDVLVGRSCDRHRRWL